MRDAIQNIYDEFTWQCLTALDTFALKSWLLTTIEWGTAKCQSTMREGTGSIHPPVVAHFTWYKASYWIITILSCLGRHESKPWK